MGVNCNDSETKYTLNRKAGRSIIERCPVFSPDGESLALIVENVVRVYNIQTGDCARVLDTENPVDELVAIEFPDDENYNLYGCSDKGCVTIWTWENGAVLREINLKIPYQTKISTFNLINANECFITAVGNSKFIHLGTYCIKTGKLLCNYPRTTPFYYNIVRVSLGWCNGDRYAAIANGGRFLFIQNLFQQHLRSEILNTNKFRIMSVSAHPRESAVAVVDTLGQCTIIRGNLYDYKNVAKEVMHWHFLPPLAVCFSMQGNYLYTGGMEKVLVKWTVGHLASKVEDRMFIPRLPGMIRYIAADSAHVAIVLTNNSVVIANPQLRVESTILECGGLSPVVRAIGTSLVYHKPLGALLMGGRTGHLQLYSTTSDKVLYNIDITEMNNIPPFRQNLLPLETEVTCAAVSAEGNWLATSEYRNDGIIYPEERLKFWAYSKSPATPFKLNTCVNLSHGGCNVVALAFNNKGEFCVSAGKDYKFRIWKKVSSSKKRTSWNCLTACYYSSGVAQFMAHGVFNDFKTSEIPSGEIAELPYMKEVSVKNDIVMKLYNIHKEHALLDERVISAGMNKNEELEMGGVAISQDGSLIAAWFGSKLTLWDTHLCNLRTTLSHPALRPRGILVQFGNKDAAHYVVCTTKNCVAVWSLLSLTVKWMVQINSTHLAADPFSNKMSLITTNNDVIVFTPHSSTPILHKRCILNPNTGVFRLCTFGASSKDDIRLYLVRNDSEIYCLEPENAEESNLETLSRRKVPKSNFSLLIAEQQLSEVKVAKPGDITQLNNEANQHSAIAQFLHGAPHMLPPINLLCKSFLQHLSGKQKQDEAAEEEQEEKMQIEQVSSDDEEVNNSTFASPYAPKTTELWIPNYDLITTTKEKRLKKILKEPFIDSIATAEMFGV